MHTSLNCCWRLATSPPLPSPPLPPPARLLLGAVMDDGSIAVGARDGGETEADEAGHCGTAGGQLGVNLTECVRGRGRGMGADGVCTGEGMWGLSEALGKGWCGGETGNQSRLSQNHSSEARTSSAYNKQCMQQAVHTMYASSTPGG